MTVMEMAHKFQTSLPQDDSEVNESKMMTKIDDLLCTRHTLSDEQTVELERLCVQYNDTSQDSKKQSQSSNNDPLQHLPAELWQDIILLASVQREIWAVPAVQRNRIDQILTLTMVSTSWKESIISTPSFWTSIGIYSTGDVAAKVATGLYLSKDLLIDLYLDLYDPIDDILRQLIGSANHRIRTLNIASSIWSGPDPDSPHSIGTLLEIFGDLSALRHIYSSLYPKWDDAMNEFVTRSRNIHTFSSNYCSIATLQLQSLSALTNFETGCSFHVILPYLQDLRALRNVKFNFCSTKMATVIPHIYK
jgi:hypothetical protein